MCAEPLAARAERCFRCETPLAGWWRFEEALASVGGGTSAAAPAISAPAVAGQPSRGDGKWLGFAILLGGGALVGALATGAWMSRNEKPGEEVATRPSPTRVAAESAGTVSAPAPDPPRSAPPLRYRVQRGDSLWRIAAALTGDGRRWRDLWPGRSSETVRAGEWLEVPARVGGP